jgi:hypothetical protein
MLQSGSNRKKRERVIGNMREMEDSKSILAGSPVAHNEPPVPIGSQTQPSEPIGDKNRIISPALKSAGYAGVGEDREDTW